MYAKNEMGSFKNKLHRHERRMEMMNLDKAKPSKEEEAAAATASALNQWKHLQSQSQKIGIIESTEWRRVKMHIIIISIRMFVCWVCECVSVLFFSAVSMNVWGVNIRVTLESFINQWENFRRNNEKEVAVASEHAYCSCAMNMAVNTPSACCSTNVQQIEASNIFTNCELHLPSNNRWIININLYFHA